MSEPLILEGRGRMLVPQGTEGPARVTLDSEALTLALADGTRTAGYRDLSTIAVQSGAALLVLGDGTGAERILLDRFGSAQGQLVRELRDRRLRQRSADALITLSDDPIGLVEYDDGAAHGVGQLAYDSWGALLAPIDERLPWIRIRRSRIGEVRSADADGSVTVGLSPAERDSTSARSVRLVGLGWAARMHADRFIGLRAAAHADAAKIVGALIPDASYAARQEATAILVDGSPAAPADLPASWSAIEAGVLVDPTFSATYQHLRTKAGTLAEARAIALAPVEPGGDGVRSWFLVPLPGNLVALELVSEGAHATYCFRIVARSAFVEGAVDPPAVADAVRAISEALVDSRFLREPMGLPDDALAQPRYLRYRLALAALPSLAAARARFVARIVHRDEASWASALDDLVAWHGTVRDDAAVWPGRAAQDAQATDEAAGPGVADGAEADAQAAVVETTQGAT